MNKNPVKANPGTDKISAFKFAPEAKYITTPMAKIKVAVDKLGCIKIRIETNPVTIKKSLYTLWPLRMFFSNFAARKIMMDNFANSLGWKPNIPITGKEGRGGGFK
jgi:hypothetical protein